jgi:hypothetical protein
LKKDSERDSSNLSQNFLKLLGIISHTKQVLMSKVRLSIIDAMLTNVNFFGSIANIHKYEIQIVVLREIIIKTDNEISSSNLMIKLLVLQTI